MIGTFNILNLSKALGRSGTVIPMWPMYEKRESNKKSIQSEITKLTDFCTLRKKYHNSLYHDKHITTLLEART